LASVLSASRYAARRHGTARLCQVAHVRDERPPEADGLRRRAGDGLSTRIPNTRRAHESTEYAREKGKLLEYHRAVFDKFYGKGEDISQWEVLRDAALQVGLDADEMQREVESGKYTAQVNAMVREAQQIGVSGVPTYVLNDRYAIVGAQPYEVFLQALKKL